jgi:hypothetical protein
MLPRNYNQVSHLPNHTSSVVIQWKGIVEGDTNLAIGQVHKIKQPFHEPVGLATVASQVGQVL